VTPAREVQPDAMHDSRVTGRGRGWSSPPRRA
jgi:hypothetical protein